MGKGRHYEIQPEVSRWTVKLYFILLSPALAYTSSVIAIDWGCCQSVYITSSALQKVTSPESCVGQNLGNNIKLSFRGYTRKRAIVSAATALVPLKPRSNCRKIRNTV